VESTVSWSISSILQQTLSDFEIICVDDFSTDSTSDILKGIASSDVRVHYVRSATKLGPGLAKNLGISRSSGKYITFVDGRDALEIDFLSSLVEEIQRSDGDLIQCRLRQVLSDRTEIVGAPAGTIEGEQAQIRLEVLDGLPYVRHRCMGSVFRADILRDKRFLPILYEDAEFMARALRSCKKVISVSEPLYNHYAESQRHIDRVFDAERDLESLAISLKPYFDVEYTTLLDKWGFSLPHCVVANASSYLERLDAALPQTSLSQKELIVELLRRFESTLLHGLPRRQFNLFQSHVYKIRQLPRRDADTLQFLAAKPKKRGAAVVNLATSFCESTLGFWDWLVPKSKSIWVFVSWGHYPIHTMDNPRAVFERILGRPEIKKVVLQNGASEMPTETLQGKNVAIVPLHSVRGLWLLARAHRIFAAYSLHNLFGYRRLQHTTREIIQLWHGIPIKKVGLEILPLEKHWRQEAPRYKITIASSSVDAATMQRSFAPHEFERIRVTGLPRHDFLVMPEFRLPRDFQAHLEMVRGRLGGRRLVLFAPTWRQGGSKSIAFNKQQLRAITRLLDAYHAVLGVRLHRHMIRAGASIELLNDKVIMMNDIPDVSVLLREAHALVTDYSSIYLDFMLLERPTILYTPDFDGYVSERGFNYEFNDFRPHDEKVDTFDALLQAVERALSRPFNSDGRYQKVLRRFHEYPADALASQRVLDAIS